MCRGRGRKGRRLLQPNVLTSDLKLDEAALEEKERRDREKLEKMVQLCYSNTCRQQWILEYFGEVDAPICGSCDVCRGEESSERRAPSDEEDLIVRKFLSGVARIVAADFHRLGGNLRAWSHYSNADREQIAGGSAGGNCTN